MKNLGWMNGWTSGAWYLDGKIINDAVDNTPEEWKKCQDAGHKIKWTYKDARSCVSRGTCEICKHFCLADSSD